MITEPLSIIYGIQEAVKQDPSLRYNTMLSKKYLGLGGALSNNAIPLPYKEDIPTVVSSAKINEEVIPNLNGKLKDMSQTGSFVDGNGVERTADEKPVPPKDEDAEFLKNLADFNRKFGRQPNDSTGIKKVAGGGIDTTGAFDEQGGVIGGTKKPTPQEEELDTIYNQQQALIDQMKTSLDASTKRQIDGIEAQFAIRKQQMAEIDRRQQRGIEQTLLMGGSSRYAQLSSAGVVAAKERDSLMNIAELDAQEKELVNAALSAQETGNFKLLEKKLDLAEKKREEKQKATETLSKAVADENKRLREEAKENREQTQFLQEQNQKKVEGLGRTVLNSLTGDEATDTAIIKGFADAYGMDANFLLNEILKQDQEKIKKELLTKEIGGSLYTYNPASQKWELSIQKPTEIKGFELGEGQTRYEFNPKTGRYEVIATKPKTIKEPFDFSKITSENAKNLANTAALVGGFSSVKAQEVFLQSIKNLAEKGNTKGLAEKITGQALANTPDADTRKRTVGGFNISLQLTRLEKLLDDYEKKGGETGFFSGNIQSLKQKVGQLGNKDLANMATQILNTLDILARSRTGAVITEDEQKLYNKILPSIDKVKELNKVIINGLRDSLIADVQNQLRFNITQEGLDMIEQELPDVFGRQIIKAPDGQEIEITN